MRSLNGNSFEVQLIFNYEFTFEEADRFLAAKSEDRPAVLNAIVCQKHPLPYDGNYNAQEFYKAVGIAMAHQRENQLKQLPETTTHDASTP